MVLQIRKTSVRVFDLAKPNSVCAVLICSNCIVGISQYEFGDVVVFVTIIYLPNRLYLGAKVYLLHMLKIKDTIHILSYRCHKYKDMVRLWTSVSWVEKTTTWKLSDPVIVSYFFNLASFLDSLRSSTCSCCTIYVGFVFSANFFEMNYVPSPAFKIESNISETWIN